MRYVCPYEGCSGYIQTPGWACVEENLICPVCKKPVVVEHECYATGDGDCIEWLSKEEDR